MFHVKHKKILHCFTLNNFYKAKNVLQTSKSKSNNLAKIRQKFMEKIKLILSHGLKMPKF